MFGALPSRMARCEHGQGQTVDLEEDDSRDVRAWIAPPWRRAIRWMTRSVYVSSSLRPKITSSTTLTADATNAVRSAQPNQSTMNACGAMLGGEQQEQGVEHEHEHEAQHERVRQAERRHDAERAPRSGSR